MTTCCLARGSVAISSICCCHFGVGPRDYRALAVDQDEAYLMLEVGEAIRADLRAAGYAPR